MEGNTHPSVGNDGATDEEHDPEFVIDRGHESQNATPEGHPNVEVNMEGAEVTQSIMRDSPSGILRRALHDIMDNGGQGRQMTLHGAMPIPREPRDLQSHRAPGAFAPRSRSSPSNFQQEEEQPPKPFWENDARLVNNWFQTMGPRRGRLQPPSNMTPMVPNFSDHVAGHDNTAPRADNPHRSSMTGAFMPQLPEPNEPSMIDGYSQPLPNRLTDHANQPGYQPASPGRDSHHLSSPGYREGSDGFHNRDTPAIANDSAIPYSSMPATPPQLPARSTPSLAPPTAQQPDPDEEINRDRARIFKRYYATKPKKPKDRDPVSATIEPPAPLTTLAHFLVTRGLVDIGYPRRDRDVDAFVNRGEHFTRASFDEFAARYTEQYREEWKKAKDSDRRSGYHHNKKKRDEQSQKKQGGSMTQSKKRKRSLSADDDYKDLEDGESDDEIEEGPARKIEAKRGRGGRGGRGEQRRRDFDDDEGEEL